MGIDKELIVSEVGKENCDCNICSQLVEDPIILKCEHFYCKQCIVEKNKEAENLEKKVECPECQQEFNPSEDMKPPTIFMRNVLSLINLKCSLCGCAQIAKYDNFAAHIAECAFNPDMEVECKHCNQLYKGREEKEHIVSCDPFMKQTVDDHFENHSPIAKDWEHSINYVSLVFFLGRLSENEPRLPR